MRGDLYQVDGGGRIASQHPLQRGQVDDAVAVGRDLVDPQAAGRERVQVGTPLARHHRHGVALAQRPDVQQE